LDILEAEREMQNLISDINNFYKEQNLLLSEQYDIFENNVKAYEDTLKQINNEYKLYQQIKKEKDEIANFDKQGLELYYKQNEELLKITDKYHYQTEMFRDQLKIAIDKKNIDEIDRGLFQEKLDAGAKELMYYYQVKEATVAKLENDKIVLSLKKELINNTIREAQETQALLENQLELAKVRLTNAQFEYDEAVKNRKSLEEQKALLEEVVKLEAQINDLNTQSLENKQKIVDANSDVAKTDEEILKTQENINDATQEQVDKAKEVTDELQKQAEWHERANDFLNQYAEEIDAVRAIIAQSLEFIAALQDRKAAEAQERIDELQGQLDDLDEQEEDRMSKLDDYNDLLKDANGERYDELLALIAQEEAANLAAQDAENTKRQEIEAQIKDEENKKLAAEARAAKWRKAQAIVDAIIQGALGVIKALPNVFLAVATGVLAAAGIATIAGQKTPPIPEGYASGGFTQKTKSNQTAVGIVHGNEYVAPAYVVKSPEAQTHIAALERQRLRGYADGGIVTPNLGSAGQSMIDYDRLITGISQAIMNMPNPQVSVVKITSAQNEVSLTKKNAGL
jgi:hypothetical protein